jgi:DNA-binding NarL/FixJ family response regulator
MDAQVAQFYLGLTRRQREVARLVSQGLTNKQIAEALCIIPSVVAGHLSAIYAEMEAHAVGGDGKRYSLIRLLCSMLERHPVLDVEQ